MEITEVHKLNKEQLTNNLIFYIRSYQIILDENKKLNEQLKLCSSSLPLKDKYAELSELAKAFIKEVDKQHPFVNLPEEEDFYMARHKLANSLKSNL